MSDVWMMSNRQPWTYLLVSGLITCKTRSLGVSLPPVGATVYLHASKALWQYWRLLAWVHEYGLDVKALPRGGVVAVATVAATGLTKDIMPECEQRFFDVMADEDGRYRYAPWEPWNCADTRTIQFRNVEPLPFIACRGALVPTRKLPPELQAYIVSEKANSQQP